MKLDAWPPVAALKAALPKRAILDEIQRVPELLRTPRLAVPLARLWSM